MESLRNKLLRFQCVLLAFHVRNLPVIGVRKNDQVCYIIVFGISINMVNMFSRLQFTSQVFFHNGTMQTSLTAERKYLFVFSWHFIGWFKTKRSKLRKMIFCETRARAIFNFTFNNSVWRNIKYVTTNFARKFSARFCLNFENSPFEQIFTLTRSRTILGGDSSFLEGTKTR